MTRRLLLEPTLAWLCASMRNFSRAPLRGAALWCLAVARGSARGDSGAAIGTHRGGRAADRIVQILEGRATDFKFRLRGPRRAHPDVLVVEVDEKSAQKYGLWPWPRDLVAKAIDNLLEPTPARSAST